MQIEDEELRDIFKTASEDHLQKLDDGFLYLEKHPDDQEKLEELLREAHSLKGDAGMLGVKDVATLAHQIEHILGSVKRGETTLNEIVSDRIYRGLDAIRQLVHEAVTGIAPQVNTFYVLAHMMGAETPAPPKNEVESQKSKVESDKEEVESQKSKVKSQKSKEKSDEEEVESQKSKEKSDKEDRGDKEEQATTDDLTPAHYPAYLDEAPPLQPALASSQEPNNFAEQKNGKAEDNLETLHTTSLPLPLSKVKIQEPQQSYRKGSSASRFAIESVRVETRHLDTLMTQAGELTVTKIRITHRLAEIEQLVNLYEEWSREASGNRFVLEEVDLRKGVSLGIGASNNRNSSLFYLRNGVTQASGSTEGIARKQLQHFHHRVQERLEQLGSIVTRLRNAMYEDNARLEVVADELSDGIRTMRLLPLSTIFNLFPRMVRDLAKQEGKEVDLALEGAETKADKRILEEMKDPLMHMIRNALDHGIETPKERQRLGKPPQGKIQLKAKQTATNVVIEVADDGRGLDTEKIKHTALKRGVCRPEELATMNPSQIQSLIFEPGFSTRTFVTEISGRGVGLDVVRTNVELLKGTIQVESKPGIGCTIRVQLPTTLATAQVLIVSVMGISYAIPVEFVQTARFISEDDIFTIEGRDTIILDNQPVSVERLADLLELSVVSSQQSAVIGNTNDKEQIPCLILKVADQRLGLLVDALVDEQDVMLKPQSQLLKRVRNVSGATILGTGEVCIILNPQDLIKSVRKQIISPKAKQIAQAQSRKQVILLVEDSISIRTQEKRILEGAGYEVVTAVDGLDGFNKLKTRSFDAVVSDIQMPNLDGLGLAAKIRQHKEYTELPIILVTSLASDEDKRRGAEAGANAYITKGTFNKEILLDTLRRLV
ncbi:hybrid sensor histidine kinase/response regulator [Argonema antarcticum]|uniref:hybrid sensor histidine kinase/response regulator n=1 Tax=Argonema antarcticum TaxID=2942763 RepID=UPI00201167EB|nr:hybrid sensor histidine kinase/response regulator [Argonema antarcticum]MCL1472796.1 hybrid sensor histidine kinase/response regulator [Argonema antarcticum A004/B2]